MRQNRFKSVAGLVGSLGTKQNDKSGFVEVPYAISNSSCNDNGVCYPWSYLFKRKRCFFDCRLQYRLKSRKTKN